LIEVLHRTFTNKIFIVKTYPNAYADANATIASLSSAAIEATPMATPMAAVGLTIA